jgi:hypothetical protein
MIEFGLCRNRLQRRRRLDRVVSAPQQAVSVQMRFESPSGAATNQIAVSPFSAEDQPFLTRVARRSHPGQTVSPRDPEALDRFFSNLQRGKLLTEPGAQAFVATIDGEPCGLVALHPDKDYFTSHPRAHSTFLSSRAKRKATVSGAR